MKDCQRCGSRTKYKICLVCKGTLRIIDRFNLVVET
jgi:hypothetical protein